MLRHNHLFGKRAVTSQAGNPVTRVEVPDIVTNGNHLTRHFTTGGKWHGWLDLVIALNDKGIRKVQTRRPDPDLDIAPSDFRAGHILNHQLVGRTVFLAENFSHG